MFYRIRFAQCLIVVAIAFAFISAARLPAQNLINDLGGVLSFSGTRSIPGIVGQVAFDPGDKSHDYVGTFGGGVLRYDYDASGANGAAIFSNQQIAVPSAITGANGTNPSGTGAANGSLAVAFHVDPVLGNVMYIAPSVPFGGFGANIPLRVQTIVRLTDNDDDGLWGEAGELNQTIVDNIVVSQVHQVNQMQIRGDQLYVCIGVRTQNGGQTTAQNQASGGSGVDQSVPGETAYTGTVSFIGNLLKLSNDTTTTNLAGFSIAGVGSGNGSLTDDSLVKVDIQPFTSTDSGKLRVWATGFRNNYGIGIDDDGEMWVSFNENENPQAPDKLQRNVTLKSHHLFFMGNDRIGRWDVTGDEDNAGLTTLNQTVLNTGWFDPVNYRSVFVTVDNNTAAGGMDFFPFDFPISDLIGDVLLARNSASGNDIVHINEQTGAVSVVLEGLTGALEVARDPFGNFVVGGSGAIGLLRVDGSVTPPMGSDPDAIHLSLGETNGDQQTLNGDVWNNLQGSSGTDNSLQFGDGDPANGISATQFVNGPSFSGNNPNDGNGIGYVPGLDPVTQSLIFAGGNIERTAVIVDGLPVGSRWTVLVYAGLSPDSRCQDIQVNNGSPLTAGFGETYDTHEPITFSDITIGANGQVLVESVNGNTDVVFLSAVSLIPIASSSYVGAHLAYAGSAFGSGPESSFTFHPFNDGALFNGPNDVSGGDPYDLFGGSSLPNDPADGALNISSLPAGTYSFLIQENQLSATEYELDFVVVQAPGSTATGPTGSLSETSGTDSISSDYTNPSTLTAGLGRNTVSGEVGGPGTGTLFADGTSAGTDGDYFTITVPLGMVIDQIMVNRYNQLQRGFLIYAPGETLEVPVLQNAAIATDKLPLLAGTQATFSNYSSYTRGINRVVVDIDNLPHNGATLSADDFLFRMGNDNTTGTWANAPTPSGVTVLADSGAGDSDRVVLTWADNVIQNNWLQVSVLANSDTAMPEDVSIGSGIGARFYFGHTIGESGTVSGSTAPVNFTDVLGPWLNQQTGVSITNSFDFNRDANVNFTDVLTSWLNQTSGLTALQLITP